ncbi:hypothetical protein EVAR_96823_1 [Eumeta japonica]|uniref:Uncharacterized protein n=1 Tax=Eumeta variegata TaxID=151549 RepID=A0A4C1WDI5_EUMVA|nr:hypothetical protein EVAR_96823_1 [Eumeta japonica]
MTVPVTHSPSLPHSPSLVYPVPNREAGNAPVTPLVLRVSMDGVYHLSNGPEPDSRKPLNIDDIVEEWTPWKYAASLPSYKVYPPVIVQTTAGRPWDIKHVAKAACLLCKPQRTVTFLDEPEMRHVYSIVYDVFRCKKNNLFFK